MSKRLMAKKRTYVQLIPNLKIIGIVKIVPEIPNEISVLFWRLIKREHATLIEDARRANFQGEFAVYGAG